MGFIKYEILFVFCCFTIHSIEAQTDLYYLSLEQLAKLSESQAKVVNIFREFIENQEYENLLEVERSLEKFETMAVESSKNPKKFIVHPINAYLMIKSLTLDLKSILSLLSPEATEKISERLRNITLPTEEDYNGALDALYRLQEMYFLNISQLSSGIIEQFVSFRPLNALECYEIGQKDHEKGKIERAIEWYKIALEQAIKEGANSTMKTIDIILFLSSSYYQMNDYFNAIQTTKNALKSDPDNEILIESLNLYKESYIREKNLNIYRLIEPDSTSLKDILNKNEVIEEKYKYNETKLIFENYETLCTEDYSLISTKRWSRLRCRYVSHHPYLKIGPVKEEQVFDDPPIWVYHNVVTEKQVEKLIELGTPHIARLVKPEEPEDYRISKTGWLNKPESAPIIGKLGYLVNAVTNLDTKNTDVFQITNYGIGGAFGPHFDFTFIEEQKKIDKTLGRRMATWMFYFEAPELGGATVFPLSGARVQPISRSAVLWYNLYPSLNGDVRSLNAECPVLVGSKWTGHMWFRSLGQELRRPCDLVKEFVEEA